MLASMGIGDLTPKEIEVLALIAQGHDAKSAARELSVAPNTIYERLRRAREKLGASNSRAAARLMFGGGSPDNEKFVSENLVLSDVQPISARPDLPGATAFAGYEANPVEVEHNDASSPWFVPSAYLPLRAPGERDMRATKIERLRLIGELSARLAMAFVAICLAAMVLSTILQRT
jgi:hypothetical protein